MVNMIHNEYSPKYILNFGDVIRFFFENESEAEKFSKDVGSHYDWVSLSSDKYFDMFQVDVTINN